MSILIDYTNWIDVCQNNGNLLAAGGDAVISRFMTREKLRSLKPFVRSIKVTNNIFMCRAVYELIF